jgi:gentisate 1,2-dioxygenase
MSQAEARPNAELHEFYRELETQKLAPLWPVTAQVLPAEPKSKVQPYLWRWSALRALMLRAGELVPLERGGERRVLALINPGLAGKLAATHTLWGAVQIVMPGEIAPCHRHTASAIRFIIEGERSYTTVNGDKCEMARGDLILTPNWTWHDHGCESDQPIIWMDGLDLPLVYDLDAVFFEFPPELRQATHATNASELKYGAPHLQPTWARPAASEPSLLNFKWQPTYDALRRVGEGAASPFDDVCFEYVNPHTGGAVLPTMSCYIQMIRAGVHTRAHRQVNSAVYHVFEGQGHSVIGGVRFDWQRGDFFVVPPWAWHEHVNDSRDEAILFSVQDTPVMQALGLYREAALDENHGYQTVISRFNS